MTLFLAGVAVGIIATLLASVMTMLLLMGTAEEAVEELEPGFEPLPPRIKTEAYWLN